MTTFRRLPGLPPYGPMATAFPTEWGRTGQEGLVVEFVCTDGSTWVGNFRPGRYGSLTDDVRWHPNNQQVLVTSAGVLWCVTPETRTAQEMAEGIFGVWTVGEPDGLVFNCWNIYFFLLGRTGVIWCTRRTSWEGFDKVRVEAGRLIGEALHYLENQSVPLSVDLNTGRGEGGSCDGPEMHPSGIAGS